MALVDSLLTAMVRANGDALVMHVGEKPIVVAQSRSIDLSNHGLNLNAMVGMLAQLLPTDAQASLEEFGAVEHRLPARGTDNFTVVAARGGDDIWIEIRRRREDSASEIESPESPMGPAERSPQELEARADTPQAAEQAPQFAEEAAPVADDVQTVAEASAVQAGPSAGTAPEAEAAPAPEAEAASEPVREAALAAVSAPAAEAEPGADVEMQVTAEEPVVIPEPEPVAAAEHPEAAIERESEPEHATTGVPTESAKVADTTAPAVSPAEEQEETAVTHDAEFPRPLTEDLTASPVSPEVTFANAQATSAVSAAGESHPVPVMASAIAGGHPAPATAPVAPTEAMPPSDGGGMGTPPSSPADLPTAASAAGSTPGGDRPGVAPVTRTVRIEVPSRSAAPRAAGADRLLRLASELGATELFLMTQARPYVRVGGEVRLLADEQALSATELDAVLSDVTPESSRDAVTRGESAEWLIELADLGRIRCASFRDHRGPGAIFHLLSTRAASAEQLGLDTDARLLATEPDGLVLVAGPAGSDKSAILSAFVDEINRHRADYMITIEPCVYLVHENVQALVSQREVGADAGRAAAATRAALSEDPDVLVIDDLASGEVAALAVEAASQDRLVLVSLEAGSTAEAVQRLIDLIPAEGRGAARDTLARTFRGAIAQQLLRKAAGGRVAARELLIGTGAVSRVLADQTRADVVGAIDAARGTSSAPLADAMAGYVKAGVVDAREAFRKAPNRERLVEALRAAGVSTAAIDRLQ